MIMTISEILSLCFLLSTFLAVSLPVSAIVDVDPSLVPGGCTAEKCDALSGTLTSTSSIVGNWMGTWNPTVDIKMLGKSGGPYVNFEVYNVSYATLGY